MNGKNIPKVNSVRFIRDVNAQNPLVGQFVHAGGQAYTELDYKDDAFSIITLEIDYQVVGRVDGNVVIRVHPEHDDEVIPHYGSPYQLTSQKDIKRSQSVTDIRFPKRGVYKFDIVFDGTPCGSALLRLK